MSEGINKRVIEWECNWMNEWARVIKKARVVVTVCSCVCGAEYWSDWGGGSFVMNKSFCTLHTAVGRANTDPSQHTEGHVTQPSYRAYEPALAHSHKPYSEMLSHCLSLPGWKTSYRMIHPSYAHQLLHSQVLASFQWTPAAPMHRKHKLCSIVYTVAFFPFHSHHFIMWHT